MFKRLVMVSALALLVAPGAASAYVGLHGDAKVAVIRGTYLHGLGGGTGKAPSRSTSLNCFMAWRSTANPEWALSTNTTPRFNWKQCRPWAANGWAISRLAKHGRWIPVAEGDETGSCHIRGYQGQPKVPVTVARDFFGHRCRGFPPGG